MTTIDMQAMQCPACRMTVEVAVVSSTSTFGPCDLDTRPAPLARENLSFEVHRCDSCGLAWPSDWDVCAEPHRTALRELTGSNAYNALARLGGRPELAQEFEQAAMVCEVAGDFAAAGWSCLRGAWACDDEGLDTAACELRLHANELWVRASEAGELFAEDASTEAAIRADVLRRAARFDEAAELAAHATDQADNPTIAAVLASIAGYAAKGYAGPASIPDALDAGG